MKLDDSRATKTLEGTRRAEDAVAGGESGVAVQQGRIARVLRRRPRLAAGAAVALAALVVVAAYRLGLTHAILQRFSSSHTASIQPAPLSPAAAAADAQSQPLGVQFDAGDLVNRFALVWWLVVVEALGLMAFPLTSLAFPGLRDRGWGLSKVVGLLVLGYLVWLPASLQVLPFDRWMVVAMFAVMACAAGAITWWRRVELLVFARRRWRLLLVCEAGFLAAFLVLALVRALDPNLYFPDLDVVPYPQFPHYFDYSGEKAFELSFITALLRSRYLPPFDAWLSGSLVNYYYYGQYLCALLIKLTGIVPTVGFNLSLALLGGMTFSSAFSLVGAFSRRAWVGLVGGFALVFASNLDAAMQALHQLHQWLLGQPVQPFDYWQGAHLYPGAINEWPYWSLIFGDLHAHIIDVVFCVVVGACCASLLVTARRTGGRWSAAVPTLAVAALTLGTIWCTNTWDLPTFGILLAVALALWTLRLGGDHVQAGWRAVLARVSWRMLLGYGVAMAAVVVVAYALFLPFHQQFQVILSGVGRAHDLTYPHIFFTQFGVWLFFALSFFAVELYDRWREPARRLAPRVKLPPRLLDGLLVALVLVLCVAGLRLQVRIGLVLLLAVGVYLALNPRHSATRLMMYLLILLGLVVALGVEVVYLRDVFDGTDRYRQNTVFKFWMQVWTLFSLGGALAFLDVLGRIAGVRLLVDAGEDDDAGDDGDGNGDAGHAAAAIRPEARRARRWGRPRAAVAASIGRGAWVLACAALVVGASLFLVLGTAARVNEPARAAQLQPPPAGVQPQGLSLNGMDFMRGWYPGDYAAITWMNAHIAGTPTIVEAADMRPYEWFARVSTYTGLPTVTGWGAHESMWHGADAAQARLNAVQAFWATDDPAAARDFLRTYSVRYVYLGEQERTCYRLDPSARCMPMTQPAIAKFDTLVAQGALRVVYRNADTVIYEVVT